MQGGCTTGSVSLSVLCARYHGVCIMFFFILIGFNARMQQVIQVD